MISTLRIMTWNANGLLDHKNELEAILETEKIDICLISETHFTNESYISFKNYSTYHTTHPTNRARGGSAVIIRNNIQHHEEKHICTEKFQITNVSIKTKQQFLTIGAVYSPPRHKISTEEYKQLLDCYQNKCLLGGDFNSKHIMWGSRLNTTKGRALSNALREANWDVVSTAKPTYWPTDCSKLPDLLDFFIVKKLSINYLHAEEGLDLSSDHSPVYLTLSDDVIMKEDNPYLTNSSTDWNFFRLKLDDQIDPEANLCCIEDIEIEALKFIKSVQKSAWESTAQTKRKKIGINYPRELRSLIAQKRKLRKKWHQTRSPSDKRNLNNASQKLKRLLRDFKSDSINLYISELSTERSSGYSLWKCTKRLKRPIKHIPPIRKPNGEWARNALDKANVFADHLEKTFSSNNTNANSNTEMCEDSNIPINEELPQVTAQEVELIIKNELENNKSPGFDLITAEILKQLTSKAIGWLTNIFNACFALKYVPTCWKVAEVVMISKPGKPLHEASSYRPISLLPTISKVFEKLLLVRLKSIIERNNLIPLHQFGFREKHSTIEQIHRITNIIEKCFEEKKVCSAVFLDVAQAFDKVWHAGLIKKLRRILPPNYCDILDSYLTDRFFRVKNENHFSELKPITAGVPQGSILGPTLYLLYTHDIPCPENTTIATFADDTAILTVADTVAQSTAQLQNAVNEIANWTTKWKIALNNTKSTRINFTTKKNHQSTN